MPRAIPKDSPAARRIRSRLDERIRSDALDLPLLPDSAARVMAACTSDGCDARGLAEMIERDPSLASHVLRVANSAAYAPEVPIVSLQQAVSRLGTGMLCAIAVSVVTQGRVFDLPGHQPRLSRLWRHSALTASWAREIARLRRRNVEAAFLAGLLHDLGKPIVLAAVGAIEELGGLEIAPDLLEELLTDLHPAVGARLLQAWDLPAWTRAAAAHHHAPDAAPDHAEEARTVCLADLLAHASEEPDRDPLEAVRGHPVLQDLELYLDDVEELLGHAARVEEFAKVFL